MSIKFNRSQTFATNGTVTAAGLHNLVDGLDIYQALITDQTSLAAVAPEDSILIADASLTAGDAPRQTTVQNLFEDALSSGTYVSLNLSGALTYGTATGNRTVSTSATITTGTIATLNSTTGTIGNLSTTLAGDLTISQGTATLGTSGVTASSYGTTSDIPRITVDAKGRITSATTVTAPVGFRNRIINGDMRIDQRNAGAELTPGNGAYSLDRWNSQASASSKYKVQQVSDAPSYFANSLKLTSLSSYTVASNEAFGVMQVIEGNNFYDFGFGASGAKTITVSFWVKSSLTGTFGGNLSNNGGGAGFRGYPFSYTINSANTWEYKTITIAGDTSGTWAGAVNTTGAYLWFFVGVHSGISGSAGSWGSSLGVTGAVSVVGTNAATWQITGVQLEAGSTATDFERRPYGTELALCQRYYTRLEWEFIGYGSGGGNVRLLGFFKQEMRATPTSIVVTQNPDYSNCSAFSSTALAANSTSVAQATVNVTSTGQISYGATTPALVTYSAEL